MSSEPRDLAPLGDADRAPRPLAQRGPFERPLDPGRLGVYAALGGAVGSVPLPWVPDALARRVRGALAQDVARRHGVVLPRDARDVLAEPSGTEGPRGIVRHAARFVVGKVLARLGPIGVLPPLRAGLETWALGHLLHRYFDVLRATRERRVDVVEARRLRQAIDQALVAALTVAAPPAGARPAPLDGDDRDPITAIVDEAIARAAGVPGWLVRRVELAFDERLAQASG